MADIQVNAPLCIAAGAIFIPVCTLAVLLRFRSRRQRGNTLGWDDWLTVPALLIQIGMCIAILVGVGWHAVGYPAPPLPPGKTMLTVQTRTQTRIRSILWAIEVMNIPALTAIKLSFLFFYCRIFYQGSKLAYRMALIFTMAMVAIWGVAYFFAFLFICPGAPDAYWTTLAEEKKKCINTAMLHNSYSTSDFLLDLIIIALPVVPVCRLKLSFQKRAALLGVFLLGSFTIIASGIRMVTYWQSTAAEFKPHTDTDILVSGAIYWTVVECGIALISCCLPSCSGLLRRNKVPKLDGYSGSYPTPQSTKILLQNSQNSQDSRVDSDAHSCDTLTGPGSSEKIEPSDEGRIHVTKTYEVMQLARP